MAVEQRTSSRARTIGFWLGLAGFLLLTVFPVDPENAAASRLAALALLMAVWWVTAAIALVATALLPLVLYPLTSGRARPGAPAAARACAGPHLAPSEEHPGPRRAGVALVPLGAARVG